jgi:hypothetical protein
MNAWFAEGVTELDDFKELQERDIKEMMNKWNVGILPQRVFLNKVSGLMLPSYDSAHLRCLLLQRKNNLRNIIQ